jgi:hypothetical protein
MVEFSPEIARLRLGFRPIVIHLEGIPRVVHKFFARA